MVTLTRTHCSGEVPLGSAHSETRQAEDRNTLRDISHEQEYYFGTETDVLASDGGQCSAVYKEFEFYAKYRRIPTKLTGDRRFNKGN